MRHMRHALGTAAVVAAVLFAASCGADPGGGAPAAPPPSTDPHASHAGVSAAPPSPLRAGERFVDVGLPEAYQPAAPNGGTDEYRCFLIDPKLTSPAYLTGSRFQPDNTAIVHHAIIYRLGPEQGREAARVDQESPGEGWTCFGDTGVQGQSAWVAHWAPGAGDTLMPDGKGFTMAPGSKLVMQVHYNLLGAQGSPADRSSMQMRLADGGTPLKALETALVMAPIELPCAAGESGPLCERDAAVADVVKRFGDASGETVAQLNQWCNGGRAPKAGNTQSCDQPVEEAGTVYLAAGHMHLLGRAIKVELNPGTPKAATIVDVPQYNFDNQALLPLAKPVAVRAGDTLRVTCTHDASLRGMLPQLKPLPPRYVVWGEGTSDEMCLGILVVEPAAR
ncbi:MAG: monooxygenase [Actinoplanes sp.]